MSENALADFRMVDLRGIDWTEVNSNRTPSGVRVTADNSMACSAYTACIRVISDAVSSLPLHVYERLANGGKTKATTHPVYRLLHTQPNPWQTAQEFRDWMTGMYLHYGASYAEIRPGARGAVSELWPLHSSRMEAERLEDGTLRYKYREPNGKQTIYSQDQIFALRFTTEDGVKPIPTYKIFQNAIGLAQALEAHGSTYFGNGARPGIVLESDNPIPVEAAERLREQWERMHRGADRAFRTAVLPNGVKAHELSGSNEAAQFLETRQYQVIEICRAFRVPPHMIQSLERSTYSNIEVQGTEFVQHCLLPHLKRWESAISRDLIVDDEIYFAEHSVSGLLRGDHASRSAYYVSALTHGWMTVNEVRELENLNPIGPEGDKHFVQLNMTTLDKVGEETPTAEPMPAPVAEAEDSPEDDTEDQTQQESHRSQQRNCGTGAGGFQPGNKCSGGGGGGGGSGDAGGGSSQGSEDSPAGASSASGNATKAVRDWADKKFSDPAHAKAFAEWFGDSKVVDEKGEPLVVYHGTGASFDEFKPSAKGMLGPGIYASADKGDYGPYSTYAGKDNAQVVPLYMSIKKPHYAVAGDFKTFDAPDGADGTILIDKRTKKILWAVAKNPTAVKSATGNRGTFDPEDPKITRGA